MTFDLIDQANALETAEQCQNIKAEMASILRGLNEDQVLGALRNMMLEQITRLIHKFPLKVQKELVAMLLEQEMQHWSEIDKVKLKNTKGQR